jgi:hypothetical protein
MIIQLWNKVFSTSTDRILSTFTKTISKLEGHALAQFDAAAKHEIAADKKMKRAEAARTEGGKARAAAQKLNNFFKE